jgi:FimV-like protein
MMASPRTRALRTIAFAVLTVCGIIVHAAGLGSIAVQSGLGEPLRVSIQLVGGDAYDVVSECIKARVSTLEGGMIATPKAGATRNGQSTTIQLTTHQNINELAVNVSVSVGCTATVHRDYQILLDPVSSLPATAAALPAESARRSGSDARSSAVTAQPPYINMVTQGKGRKRHLVKSPGTRPQATRDPATATALPALRKAARISSSRMKKVSHGVLTLSIAGEETGGQELDRHDTALTLKLATTLSASASETDAQKLADIRVRQARLAALLRDEDPGQAAEARLRFVQHEMQDIRAQSDLLKQQERSEQAAMQAMRNDLRHWIVGLGAAVLACFGAIGWLLWRLFVARKNDRHASWSRIIEGHDTGSGDFTHPGDVVELDYSAPFNDTYWPTGSDQHAPDPQAVAAERVAGSAAELNGDERDAASRPAIEDPIPYLATNRREPDHSRDPSGHVLDVEEVLDITELAEVWVALHQDPMKLLELLEPFKDVEKPDSPLPWLCLLDVYRAIGDVRKYEATAQRIKKVYNVKVASWDAEASAGQNQTLSDLPHVTEKILDLWGSPDIVPYLQGLLSDQRDGTRDGFELAVYRSIMQLLKLASTPNRSKRDDQKAYAVLFGANTQRPDAAPDKSGGDAAAASPPVEGPVRPAPSGNSQPGKSHAPVARHETAVREWLVEESADPQQAVPLSPVASRPVAAPDQTPARKQVKSTSVARRGAAPGRANSTTTDAIDVRVISTAADTPARSESSRDAVDAIDAEEMSTMAIRLHLAISYQDIGDEEGAQELLYEVIKDGTPELAARARLILSQLHQAVPAGPENGSALAAFR